MQAYFPIFNSDEDNQCQRVKARFDHEVMLEVECLRHYLRRPSIRSRIMGDALGLDLATLSEVLFENPLPLESVLEHLPSSLKSLPQVTGDITSNKVQASSSLLCQPSIGDEEELNSSQRSRSRVQSCFVLDVEHLVNYGLLRPDGPERGVLLLTNVYAGWLRFIVWEIERFSRHALLTLYFEGPEEKLYASRIEIWRTQRRPNSIWANWRLRCPCPHDLESSSKTSRVRMLYLQPGGSIFACSRCLNLDRHRSKDMRRMPLSNSVVFARQSDKTTVTGNSLDVFDNAVSTMGLDRPGGRQIRPIFVRQKSHKIGHVL
ncbi:MAG: hypothetical protein ACYDHG_11170 [Desulfomonilaceae bacterium]